MLVAISEQIENEDEAAVIKDSQGLTPVMFAAKHGYNESLNQLVLQNSNNINEEDKNCQTILMHVLLAENVDYKLAKRLIRKGADVNHVDSNGNTLLIKLVQNGKNFQKQVEFMLERGALQHLQDLEGKDACDYAKANEMALEMRQFMDCSIRKKQAHMEELTNLQ